MPAWMLSGLSSQDGITGDEGDVMPGERGFKGFIAVLVLVLVTAVVPTSSGADVLNDAVENVLPREPQVTPDSLGEAELEGLQYADPTEQIDLVDPPVANNQGSAEVTHPLSVPAGRGGMQPDLSFDYSSEAGTTWLGTGWDFSVGAVTVDTRWGVPRYLSDKESETYLLDGQVLSPTAVRSELEDRVANRSDYTRRVETQHERIVRHGDDPQNYWWEVIDKSGATRFYGGTPETGQQPEATLADDQGNGFRWALTRQQDISRNTINYFYETEDGHNVGAGNATTGRQLYLDRITYTGSVADGVADDPAYEVRFLRDHDIDPTPTQRQDVTVSARGGFLEVTADLLRRIEVRYGQPNDGNARSYDTLVRRFDLNYTEGAFGKTLLASVDQRGADEEIFASHGFDYFDDVREGGEYVGFADQRSWSVDDDGVDRFLLDFIDASILGASETFGGDAHGYLGFNLAAGKKTGSVGGAITVNGGATEAFAEMVDINGDGLPDKVFREDGDVVFRLNTSGPSGNETFAESTHSVVGIDRLSTDWDVGLAGGPEAHLGISVQFSAGATVSVGEEYFTDVNSDGLPDFVSGGTVHFNHLDMVGEQLVPTFTTNSAETEVPIDDGTIDIPEIAALTELEARQRAESPLFDTVRRWVAPLEGTVEITAPVEFDPPPPGGLGTTDGDGVRAAIQHGDSELWSETLTTPDQVATPTGVDAIEVERGEAIYFRLQSIDDGARDRVNWDPAITYTSYEETSENDPALDGNGLSQKTYSASDDFTLAGRPGTLIGMPLEGTVRFETDLRRTKTLTDDLTVLVIRNGEIVYEKEIPSSPDDDPDEVLHLSAEFPVDAPTADESDEIEVRIEVDSPIDVTAIEWEPRLYYIEATSGGEPIDVLDPDGEPLLELFVPADIDIYPHNNRIAPVSPWVAERTEAVTISAELQTTAIPFEVIEGDAVLTVKSRDSLIAKRTINVEAKDWTWNFPEFEISVTEGEEYFFDISVRDPDLADAIVVNSAEVTGTYIREEGDPPEEVDVTEILPSTLHWSGRQGIFPLAYRGWSYAGYNGDGERATEPIDEGAFVLDYDEDDFPSDEPEGFDDEDYEDPMDGDSYPYTPYRLDTADAPGVPVWRGLKDNQVGGAGFASSSRQGVDSPGVFDPTDAGAGARAPRRVGITAPTFSVSGGIGPLSGSLGASPSLGLVDYMDLNGDGYPDVVTPGDVDFTGPRGGYFDDGNDADVGDSVRQDTTFAVSGGFAGSPLTINANSKGDANTAQDTSSTSGTAQSKSSAAATQGGSASDDAYGFDIGGSIGATAKITNPSNPAGDWSDGIDAMPDELKLGQERDIADVNGDGLPDKVTTDGDSVSVSFNLGYGFSDEVEWADSSGFERGLSFSGSVGATLGFQIGNKAFSGGLSYNESVDFPLVSWVDVDGDGILDRLSKPVDGDIEVAFGSGSGLLPAVDYGAFVEGEYELDGISGLPGVPAIPIGEQISQSRSRGLGGGADFTIGIGPLCIKACYLIINPGAHVEHSISTTQVQLTDVNGDGYPDSVFSTDDDELKVRRNTRGRTNLLASVSNPLGGEIRLDYERSGNTVDQPYSQWVMTSVEVDDNRPGDGPDTLWTTYEYSGNKYNHLEREMLGYEKVLEHQRDISDPDSGPLRSIERLYRHGSVFESGLLESETLLDGEGDKIKGTNTEWSFIDLATGDPAVLESDTDPAGLHLLEMAVAPRRTKIEPVWYNADGSIAKNTWNSYEYDDLGNVIRQVDVGEPELGDDDVTAVTTYSDCRDSSWVSLPATFEVTDADGGTLRQRDGSADLCANGAVTHLVESIGDGTTAVTDLEFDAWGSYDRITYPENAAGERLVVEYVYDADRHTDISHVVDSHGLTSTASYHGPSGRLASRTDANGHTTTYTYDAVGRLSTIKGPYEQGGDTATVTFEYHPTDNAYAYAVARHYDAFNPGDTIDTVAFVDGIGRETQTKHDATLFRGVGDPAQDVMVVSGAVVFDAVGRPVQEWYPIEEPLGTIDVYNTATSDTGPTTTSWTLTDLVTRVETPNGAATETSYEYEGFDDSGATLFETTRIDPEGKPTRTYTDVRGLMHAVDDMPVGAPLVRTQYDHDGLGQLTGVVDSAGNETTHIYDQIGRRISTTTPDGGLHQWFWDTASNLIAEIDPNLREASHQIEYQYDYDRLIAVDYPDDTPDVSYTYG
ncbi:MAG: hypothetical protein GEU79_05340, partial [Acidimicrobiia bacterium]|nr:hypothetical protein [Acidimicrobiia bacterium]